MEQLAITILKYREDIFTCNNVEVQFIENLGVVIKLKVQTPSNNDSQYFRNSLESRLEIYSECFEFERGSDFLYF